MFDFWGLRAFFESYPSFWLVALAALVVLVLVALVGSEIRAKRPEWALLYVSAAFVMIGVAWKLTAVIETTYGMDDYSAYTNMDESSFALPFMLAGVLLVVTVVVAIARRGKRRQQRFQRSIAAIGQL